MTLDVDISNVQNKNEICFEDDHWSGVTTAIGHLAMAVRLREITEKNWKKWFTRCRLHELSFGRLLIRPEGWEGEEYITPEEVKAHIGLRTNVEDVTDAQWRKDFFESFTNEIHWRTLRNF